MYPVPRLPTDPRTHTYIPTQTPTLTYPRARPRHHHLAQAELPGEDALRPREEADDGAPAPTTGTGAAGDHLEVRRGEAEVRERPLEEGHQAHVFVAGEKAGARGEVAEVARDGVEPAGQQHARGEARQGPRPHQRLLLLCLAPAAGAAPAVRDRDPLDELKGDGHAREGGLELLQQRGGGGGGGRGVGGRGRLHPGHGHGGPVARRLRGRWEKGRGPEEQTEEEDEEAARGDPHGSFVVVLGCWRCAGWLAGWVLVPVQCECVCVGPCSTSRY